MAFIHVDSPSIESILVVCELMDVFSTDLLGVLLDRDIDFAIDVKLSTKPTSIPLYHMAPAKLKELKD